MDDTLVEKVLEIKEQVNEAKEEMTKAEGAKEQLLTQLQSEFNISSASKGRQLKKKLTKEVEELSEQLQEEVDNFDNEFGDNLENDSDEEDFDDDE